MRAKVSCFIKVPSEVLYSRWNSICDFNCNHEAGMKRRSIAPNVSASPEKKARGKYTVAEEAPAQDDALSQRERAKLWAESQAAGKSKTPAKVAAKSDTPIKVRSKTPVKVVKTVEPVEVEPPKDIKKEKTPPPVVEAPARETRRKSVISTAKTTTVSKRKSIASTVASVVKPFSK